MTLQFGWFSWIAPVPAILLVGIWFLTQVFSPVGALTRIQAGGTARMAHTGGFVFGLILGQLFKSHRRRREQRLNGAK